MDFDSEFRTRFGATGGPGFPLTTGLLGGTLGAGRFGLWVDPGDWVGLEAGTNVRSPGEERCLLYLCLMLGGGSGGRSSREGGREGRREEGREGGREGGRERRREREM